MAITKIVMIKKLAVVYSVFIHILLVIIIILIKLDEQQERTDGEIYLEYTFIDEPQPNKKNQTTRAAVKEIEKILLPPVELPGENITESVSTVIIPDTTFSTVQSLAIMPRDSLTILDSLLITDPNFLAFRTVFMEEVRNDTPEDTSKKWREITPVSIEEYISMLKYSDGFNNARMQKEYNTGGIKIPLDAIFDLFK